MNKHRTLVTLAAITILALGGAAAGYFLYTPQVNSPNSNSSSSSNANNTTPKNPIKGAPITVTGEIVCLTHKDTSGPVDAMCAIGLTGDDGKNYALSADDPTLTGSIPTGQQVKITGSFAEQSSQYNSAGIIKVESLTRQ